MNARVFNKMVEELEEKIEMVDEFLTRAHREGISKLEAIAMQNHIRREFSPKQRAGFRRQIASLYRDGRITLEQKERMEALLDKASKMTDKHFVRLSSLIPEKTPIKAPDGLLGFFKHNVKESKLNNILHRLKSGAS